MRVAGVKLLAFERLALASRKAMRPGRGHVSTFVRPENLRAFAYADKGDPARDPLRGDALVTCVLL